MSSIFEQIEVLRLERDPHAQYHAPEHPYRLALFNPDTNILEDRPDEETHAVINLNTQQLLALRDLADKLLAEAVTL
ncbi:hypothetical protein [Deinococcus ruber]|uniref:Uncharacterized protein n=1 Tax=Deinococcus ruber TaxID=1848197 RepID=A0A918FER8_9DEIO|nr:hypothetical protein [Deinococcus ruber]GGR31193.1 hypothetical protein GCM10008957_47310 [Deinococcus ruber]